MKRPTSPPSFHVNMNEPQAIAALDEADVVLAPHSPVVYSKSSPERLAIVNPARLAEARASSDEGPNPPPTVLYLAYGSNLCAATFRGRRGIKPLAAVNVVVPSLTLSFDLPGIPYIEPCFATTNYRTASLLDLKTTPDEETSLLGYGMKEAGKTRYDNPVWDHGLVGVVYEVTQADYAHIIQTEGGGSSYQGIMVECYDLPKDSARVPDDFDTPPFKAHTLFTPPLEGGGKRGDGRKPGYAQASLRYLKLLREGSKEHSLPADYMQYLDSLQPFTLTTKKQRLGQFVFRLMWYPWFIFIFAVSKLLAGRDGKSPKWVTWFLEALFESAWRSYDNFFKGIFGDGERTMKKK